MSLSWSNPSDSDYAGVLVVRKSGSAPPTSRTDGTTVAQIKTPKTSFTDTALAAGSTYAYSLFTYDKKKNYSAAVSAVASTSDASPTVITLHGALTTNTTLTTGQADLFILDDVTVPAKKTLTFGPGIKVKVGTSLRVAGTLRGAGKAGALPLVTTSYDDSVGGNYPNTDGTAKDNLATLDMFGQGKTTLKLVDLRYINLSNYYADPQKPPSVTLANSRVADSKVDLRYGKTNTQLTSNTFTRSTVSLAQQTRPVVTGNMFADGAPLDAGIAPQASVQFADIKDLSGIGANTATGAPAQRLITFIRSSVAGSWTLQPSTGFIYGMSEITVPANSRLVLGPGSLVKATTSAFAVSGTLALAGTGANPAAVTSFDDDSLGGDTDVGNTNDAGLGDLSLTPGGTITTDHAQIHHTRIWNYYLRNGEPGATITATNSAIRDSEVDLRYGSTNTQLTDNTFTRSSVSLAQQTRPVVTGNTFADGHALNSPNEPGPPLHLDVVSDLSGIGANTATGAPIQRMIRFTQSSVAGSWTLQPATGFTYGMSQITVLKNATLTVGPGALIKATASAIDVAGTLSLAGTASAPAVVTSAADDSLGGDTDNSSNTSLDNGGLIDLSLTPGGTITTDRAQIHHTRIWNYYLRNGEPGATVTATNSAVLDSEVDLRYGSTNTQLTDNTFTRSTVSLAQQTRPVVTGNTFADGYALGSPNEPGSPLRVHHVGDLSGIGANTATGTSAQRRFIFTQSPVLGTWTLQPDTSNTYEVDDVTVEDGGTITARSGARVESIGSITVRSGGSLTGSSTTFTAVPGQGWSGLTVDTGATVAISNSTFSHASYAVRANANWVPGQAFASVAITDSDFSTNGYDIENYPKDLPRGSAIDAYGSSVTSISSHSHLCIPPPDTNLPPFERTLFDVEDGVHHDSPDCPKVYKESTGHPTSPVG